MANGACARSRLQPTATSINGTTIPSSKTLTVTTDNLSVFAATTSAQLAGVISDETGTDKLVYSTTPTLVTPVLGAATATSITLPNGGAGGETSTALTRNEVFTHTSTINGNSGGTPSSTCSFKFSLVGGSVTMTTATCNDALPTGGSGHLVLTTAFPARFRPAVSFNFPVLYYNNNVISTTYGYIQIGTAGTIDLYRDTSTTAFTNSSAAGPAGYTISWSL